MISDNTYDRTNHSLSELNPELLREVIHTQILLIYARAEPMSKYSNHSFPDTLNTEEMSFIVTTIILTVFNLLAFLFFQTMKQPYILVIAEILIWNYHLTYI